MNGRGTKFQAMASSIFYYGYKGSELAARAIDAPVGNNPVALRRGSRRKKFEECAGNAKQSGLS